MWCFGLGMRPTSTIHLKRAHKTLFMQLMAESNIQQKVTEALQPLDITAEVDTIVAEYEQKSLGPASSEILDKCILVIEQLTSILKKIPGRP